ncbi:MAG: hypothetical protein DRJ61_00570 [Acidobacteria bacterium]|nr:MAG: hypothetical protein DRJ61_00570 [Acidobacteriota bacterium]
MVHSFTLNGLPLQTGDLICTTDGDDRDLVGQFWRLLGKLIPGEVDHIVVYVGPSGRCVEAAARGKVTEFKIQGDTWDFDSMLAQRGVRDHLVGISYPLANPDLLNGEIINIREDVASYCLEQAATGKPYNLNFFDSKTEDAFYCSQLAYQAYLKNDIDLNTNIGVPNLPFSERIVFPQEIWNGCRHRRARGDTDTKRD